MSVASVELLRFILGLLGDPSKADEFTENPSGALASAGLSNVSCADVDAITPLIANSVPGAVAIAYSEAASPSEMIHHIVKNVAMNTFDNSGVIQNIWSTGDVRQAFASDGGLAFGGDLLTNDPVVVGDGNIIASDDAHAAGRDIIQNQGEGNLALGGDQTIAQDSGVIAGGDSLAGGDKVGGNNNEASNTGNDNSVSVGGNQNNAANTGNDNSVSVGGNQNNAENTGNSTVHDESVTVGDISIDNSDHSDNSDRSDNSDHSDNSTTIGDVSLDLSSDTTVGGNQNNAENTGNTTNHDQSTSVGGSQNNAANTGNVTNHDESTTVGNVGIDLSQDSSVGGDYWADGSNVGGIGNTDSRNSNNTSDSGNTVVLTENNDNSISVGTVAVDLSQDNSVTVGDVTLTDDHSVTSGDTNTTVVDDHSTTSGDTVTTVVDDNSLTVGDVTLDSSTTVGDVSLDNSYTGGDTTWVDNDSYTTNDYDYTYTDSSVGGNFYEDGGSSYGDYAAASAGNTSIDVGIDTTVNTGAVIDNTEYTWDGA